MESEKVKEWFDQWPLILNELQLKKTKDRFIFLKNKNNDITHINLFINKCGVLLECYMDKKIILIARLLHLYLNSCVCVTSWRFQRHAGERASGWEINRSTQSSRAPDPVDLPTVLGEYHIGPECTRMLVNSSRTAGRSCLPLQRLLDVSLVFQF